MKNLKKENEALKSYVETLRNDRKVLMLQVDKLERQIDELKLQNESLCNKIEYLENIKN